MSKGIWGSFSTIIVFAVVVVSGAYLTGNHADAVKQTFDYHTNDNVLLSRASVYGDYMDNSYTPRAFNLSVDRSIYRLSENDASMDWSSSDIPKNNLEGRLESKLESRIERNLTGYINEADNSIGCSISGSYSVDIDYGDETKTASGDNPAVECVASNVQATYGLSKNIETSFDDKSFFDLVEETHSIAEDIKTESPTEVVRSASHTSACKLDRAAITESSIESEASQQAKSEAVDYFRSDLNPDVDTSGDGEINLEFDYRSFNPSYSSAVIQEDETGYDPCQLYVGCSGEGASYSLSSSECIDHENGTREYTTGEEYEATAVYNLDRAVFDIKAEDPISSDSDMDKWLTSEGVRKPQFDVVYTHNLQ